MIPGKVTIDGVDFGIYNFNIGGRTFSLFDFGKSMNEQFLTFYVDYFYQNIFAKHLLDNFEKQMLDTLTEINKDESVSVVKQNRLFENFMDMWEDLIFQRRFKDAEKLWRYVLEIATKWEDQHPDAAKIHKGTPFYWWAGTCILNGELEDGFLLMHKALEEDRGPYDKENNRYTGSYADCIEKSPAFKFVTLDYESSYQYFRDEVRRIRDFVNEKLLSEYNKQSPDYKIDTLRNNFLGKSDFFKDEKLLGVIFYFVFEMFVLDKLFKDTGKRMKDSHFGNLMETTILFDLCFLIENVIRMQKKYPKNTEVQESIGPLIEFISAKKELCLGKDSTYSYIDKKDGKKKLKKILYAIGIEFNDDLSSIVEKLLDTKYKFKYVDDQLNVFERNLALVYYIRNFGGHRIEKKDIINKKFDDILNGVLCVMFYGIENLY
ncbi:MAG: hypothetical protein WC974_01105 [Thermoplasmata archaeon]